jgi:xylulokinase
MADAPFFLGLDSSTQSLKTILIDDQLAVQGEWSVNFDADLPQYQTRGGVHTAPDGLAVTSPTAMWMEALDRLLDRMHQDRCPFARIAAVSGSGQQHGSVYWRRGARARLASLNPQAPVLGQLRTAFAVEASPIWMDSSTGAECREREQALGGAQAVADLTGSRAYERFTGNQIARIHRLRPDDYAATERIALVSSFMASLLIGDYAPIDVSDGSGMNLMNLRTRQWDSRSLDITAPDLGGRLGPLAFAHETAGLVSRYHQQRYGFGPQTPVIVFSGDNPNSLAGLRLKEAGDVAISLGTSDTLFAALRDPTPSGEEGHLFASPVDPEGYMALVCFKNGSLTREAIRESCGAKNWADFARLLEQTPPGNRGNIGFYIEVPEITPPLLIPGRRRFDADDRPVATFDPATEARAVYESQMLSMCRHGDRLGIRPKTILATGGASRDAALLRVMANVFGVPVWVAEQANSAALGAAYRARHGRMCRDRGRFVPFGEAVAQAPAFRKAVDPDPNAHRLYADLRDRFGRLEQRL